MLEYQYWKVAFLQNFRVEDVVRTGTVNQKVITGSMTLECRCPQANGAIINIQPS